MESRARASSSLFGYAFRFFETHKYYSQGDEVTSAAVWKGETDEVALGIEDDLWLTIPRGQLKNIQPMVEMRPDINAPIEINTVLGSVKLMLEDEQLATLPLIALEAIPEGDIIKRIQDEIKLFFQ
jgi:D-alanyl-D-alanine carboxypeptidase (penicillin-binding protein 5/6)